MLDHPRPDESRLLAVASAIANGDPVDWTRRPPDADAETTAVLDQLRRLETLARLNDPIPNTWGPFTITGELGHGAYGTVYRALDPSLDLEVALKVIRPRGTGATAGASRALDEARLLAQVNHPEVVRVYRAEQVGDEVGIEMELVRGRTLHDVVHKQGPMDARDAIRIGLAVCRALTAVHGTRLVHGDVKAQNVMLADEGRVVLMDFGTGHDLKRAAARAGSGTPLYMAPEVHAGSPPSTASDIYSVGVLLFHLVTGAYPVTIEHRPGPRGTKAPSVRRALRDARSDLPGAFVRVVERATAERADARYSSAGDLASALEAALRHAAPDRRVSWLPYAAMAAALAAALGLTAVFTAPWFSGGYSVEGALYRDADGADVKLDQGGHIAPGDRLSLQIEASRELYVFVANEDDQGESYLLFPLPGQSLTNPLPPGQRHRLPGLYRGEPVYWNVTSAGGREHFVVYAMPEPPPPELARYLDSLPRPSPDRPVVAERLPDSTVRTLRGVGGLAQRPSTGARPRLIDPGYATLTGLREDASGMWIRALTLQNPPPVP